MTSKQNDDYIDIKSAIRQAVITNPLFKNWLIGIISASPYNPQRELSQNDVFFYLGQQHLAREILLFADILPKGDEL